jgi:SET domain-containing protein
MDKYAEVKESKIHTKGVFAKQDIPKDTLITEYSGEKITKEEGGRRVELSHDTHLQNKEKAGTYLFELNDEYDIDGDMPGNDAKYINHSCDPNCEYRIIDDKIYIYSIRDIKKGEEITYNYGFSFDTDDYEEYKCNCGTEKCVGYMVSKEDWPKLIEHLKNKKTGN